MLDCRKTDMTLVPLRCKRHHVPLLHSLCRFWARRLESPDHIYVGWLAMVCLEPPIWTSTFATVANTRCRF